MQGKTTGIVLHSVKYADSSTIITVYTEQFGRVSYMVYGANKKKSAIRMALLQPLSIVGMDVFHSPGKEIQRIKDIRMEHLFTGIPSDPVKNALALFISEVLFRSLRQTDPDEALFAFLENSILQLDLCGPGIANFHLIFLLRLSRYLGFEPNTEGGVTSYFDMLNGVFQASKPLHGHYLSGEEAELFERALMSDFSNMHEIALQRQRRARLLDNIIEYYKLHLPEFHGLHSLPILHSLFD